MRAIALILGLVLTVAARAGTYVVTTSLDAGPGSLRQAILNANTSGLSAIISFNIAGGGLHTIAPSTPLPTIEVPVDLAGSSQPGYVATPLIEISGSSLTSQNVDGLDITGGQSVVEGLTIDGFANNQLSLSGGGGNKVY